MSKYVLIVHDKAEGLDELASRPLHGIYETLGEAVTAGKEFIASTEAEECGGYAVSVVGLDSAQDPPLVLLNN